MVPHCRLARLLLLCVLLASAAATADPLVPGYPVSLCAGELPASVLWLRQLPVRAARMRAWPRIDACDGLDTTALPLPHPLEIELARSFPVSYLEVEGTQALRLRSGDQTLGDPTRPPRARVLLAAPVKLRRLTLVAEGAAGTVAEARAYQSTLAPLPPVELVPIAPDAAAAPPTRSFTLPVPQAQGITAVALRAELQAPFPPGLRVRLTHSPEPERAWYQADLRLTPPADAADACLALVLDPPDLWCGEGEHLTLTLSPLTAAGDPEEASAPRLGQVSAGLVTAGAEEVRDEFIVPRLNWLAGWYAAHVREAPWERPGWQPEREPAGRWLRLLREWLPRHPGVIAYASRVLRLPRQSPAPEEGPENAPAWACLASRLLRQTQDVAYWWRSGHQQPDGLFSGDPDADAALLETLATAPLITGEPTLARAFSDACEAAWRAAAGPSAAGLDEAWAAPLTLDRLRGPVRALARTQPLLALLAPEEAIALRRCLELSRPLTRWTAVNARGHRHSLLVPPPAAEGPAAGAPVDLPGATEAAGPALTFAWHCDHLALKRLLQEWAAAWATDALAAVNPREPGKLPPALDARTCSPLAALAGLPSGEVEGARLLRFLLDVHQLSGDAELLRPVKLGADAGTAGPLATCLWRATGDRELDEQILQAPDDRAGLGAYAAWLITGNKQFLIAGLEAAVARIEAERYLLTEAHLPPDALEVPGLLLLRALYLGGVGPWQGGLPRVTVTWERTGAAFAALVAVDRPDALKVLAYNFGPVRRPVRMRVWRLRPGTFRLSAGPDDDQDDQADNEAEKRLVEVGRGEAVPFTLPAQRPYVVTLTPHRLHPEGPLPDVALCGDEVKLSADRRRVEVTLRNLGAATATGVQVRVLNEQGQPLGTTTVPTLGWPEDLRPALATTSVTLSQPATGPLKVTATLATPEITTRNNTVTLTPP